MNKRYRHLFGTTELTHCVVGVFHQKLVTVFTDLVNNLQYETMTFNDAPYESAIGPYVSQMNPVHIHSPCLSKWLRQ